MADIINIQVEQLQERIDQLGEIKETLASGFNTSSYAFGSGSAVSSMGASADSMVLLNSEYKSTTDKLSALVDATISYLTNVLNTFIEADSI
jgi:hypothetical protein